MIRSLSYSAPSFSLLYCPHSQERYRHTSAVNDVLIINGETLISCGDDGKVILWKLNQSYYTKPHAYSDLRSEPLISTCDCVEIKHCKLHCLAYDPVTLTVYAGGTKGLMYSIRFSDPLLTNFASTKPIKSASSREICHIVIVPQERLMFIASFDHRVVCSEIIESTLVVPLCCWTDMASSPIRYINFLHENNDTFMLLSTHDLDGLKIFALPRYSQIKALLSASDRAQITHDHTSKENQKDQYLYSKKFDKELLSKTARVFARQCTSLGSPRTAENAINIRYHSDHPRTILVDGMNVFSCDHSGNILMFTLRNGMLSKPKDISCSALLNLKRPAPEEMVFSYTADANKGGIAVRYGVGTWWTGDGRSKIAERVFEIRENGTVSTSLASNSLIGSNTGASATGFEHIEPEMPWKKYLNANSPQASQPSAQFGTTSNQQQEQLQQQQQTPAPLQQNSFSILGRELNLNGNNAMFPQQLPVAEVPIVPRQKLAPIYIPFNIPYGNTGKIRSIAKTDLLLASAGEDRYMTIWNIFKQAPILKLEGGLDQLMGVKFWDEAQSKIAPIKFDNESFNGKVHVLITYGKDSCVYVWAIRVE